jgi:hypothetical protein
VGCGEMGREGPDLGVGDLLVPADLLCDGGPELSGGDDVLEVVDLHDGRDGAAGLLEEVKHPVPRLLKRCRVRRHLHRAHRERHRRLLLRPSSVLRRQVLCWLIGVPLDWARQARCLHMCGSTEVGRGMLEARVLLVGLVTPRA